MAVSRRVRAFLFAFLLAASVAHADATLPPATTVVPEIAAAAARFTFETGRPTLRREALSAVDAIAAWLRAHPAARIEIGVHTDDRGAAEWNLRMSQARAEVVRDAFVEKKVATDRMVAATARRSRSCRTRARRGRKRNRRVEVRVLAAAR